MSENNKYSHVVEQLTVEGLYSRYRGGSGQGVTVDIGNLNDNLSYSNIPALGSRLYSLNLSNGKHIVSLNDLGASFTGDEKYTVGGLAVNVTVTVSKKDGEITVTSGTWSQNRPDSYDFSPVWADHRSFMGNFATAVERVFEAITPPFSFFAKPFDITIQGTRQINGSATFSTAPRCFLARTLISTANGERVISELRVGDKVWAFDARADKGRGGLALKRIKRLYRNITTELVKLSWVEDAEHKELICTPGHHFLDEYGSFPIIDKMVKHGKATVVLVSGALAKVKAERIVYSEETAHLFEQAQNVGVLFGNSALAPVYEDGWQTYNFEVEDFHTYIAQGVRVHNDSGFLGEIGNLHDAVRDARDNPFNSRNPSSALSQDSQYGEEGGFVNSEYDRAHNSANGFEGGNNGGGASNKENFCDGWANDNDFEEMDIIKQVSSNRLIYVNYVSYGCFLKH